MSTLRDGEYMSLSKVIEGQGPTAEDAEAAMNRVQYCIERFKKGITLNGRPFMDYNESTRRWDFLDWKKKYKEKNDTKFEHTHEEAPVEYDSVAQSSELIAKPAAKPEAKARTKKPSQLGSSSADIAKDDKGDQEKQEKGGKRHGKEGGKEVKRFGDKELWKRVKELKMKQGPSCIQVPAP